MQGAGRDAIRARREARRVILTVAVRSRTGAASAVARTFCCPCVSRPSRAPADARIRHSGIILKSLMSAFFCRRLEVIMICGASKSEYTNLQTASAPRILTWRTRPRLLTIDLEEFADIDDIAVDSVFEYAIKRDETLRKFRDRAILDRRGRAAEFRAGFVVTDAHPRGDRERAWWGLRSWHVLKVSDESVDDRRSQATHVAG